MKTNFSIVLTDEEERAFNDLAARFAPDMQRGAKAALFRHWLHQAAQDAGIPIQHKTRYGGPRRKK